MSSNVENVDPSEIAKFEKLASRWWDQEGDMKALHDINPLRANFIDKLANVAEKNILDVGCGAGILSEALAQRGANVCAIDMGAEPLQVAKLHLYESNLNIDYQQSTAEALAEKVASGEHKAFDVITCMEMLEHVPDPQSVITACANMCEAGGDVFFSTINRNPKSFAFAIVGAEYVLNLVPKGTHAYEKMIKPSELAAMARQAGLVIQDIAGMEYNPITKQYSLTDDASVNYLMHAKKPV
ncbi:MAG: bifunctional 2-polyprenyl-6-hydroxyphenol methylase/3-demethylubiquinol 3-O-methyltransferase UbiG [Sinobacterium sp.]|nr:bifunctional 2-polyprenyl-6-hydroxyphenol methylase/3-demethylubiquinol 3-O-methyltransferase UbiG [Sinobacterium sp.]